MINCEPRCTPCENKLKLDTEGQSADQKKYREVVESLLYVMI